MSDVVVVDASLGIKWVLFEEDSATATVLLTRWINQGKEIIAPALFTYEITNILYRKVVKKQLTYDEASQGLTKLFSLEIVLNFSLYQDVSRQAMKLAQNFRLPATYDAHYLALAQQENCELWIADIRLWNSVKNKLSWVHWLGDYQP